MVLLLFISQRLRLALLMLPLALSVCLLFLSSGFAVNVGGDLLLLLMLQLLLGHTSFTVRINLIAKRL